MESNNNPRVIAGAQYSTANQFLDISNHDTDRRPPKRIYAISESSEAILNGQVIKFSGVDADWFDYYAFQSSINPHRNVFEFLAKAEIWILELILSNSIDKNTYDGIEFFLNELRFLSYSMTRRKTPRGAFIDLTRRGWWEIQFEDKFQLSGALEANIYPNLFAKPRPISISSMRSIRDKKMRTALNAGNPLDTVEIASISEICDAFPNDNLKKYITMAAIYDVGQGSCAAALNNGAPEVYMDFGGGVLGNTSTFPLAMTGFCFTNRPPIVLSHWDWDHWSSAQRDRRAFACDWIVPKQTQLGHVHRAFVADVLANGGRFLIWPPGLSMNVAPWLKIESCTGTTRNSSGLAATLYPPSELHGNPILFPGDANLTHIPSVVGRSNFDSIVCSHHGGRMNTVYIPPCPSAQHSRLAYSFGPGNTYMHALAKTRERHHGAGWTDANLDPGSINIVRETANRPNGQLGHIAIGWSPIATPIAPPCGEACSLGICQS